MCDHESFSLSTHSSKVIQNCTARHDANVERTWTQSNAYAQGAAVSAVLSSVTHSLQGDICVAEGTGLSKQEVGRTMVLLQTGYEAFLMGHTENLNH